MRNRRERAGTEPVSARSPLRLRILLSAIFAPLFAAAAAGFAVAASGAHEDRSTLYAVLAAMCAVLAVIAVADIAAVVRRKRAQR